MHIAHAVQAQATDASLVGRVYSKRSHRAIQEH
jgi:hypothetical protein